MRIKYLSFTIIFITFLIFNINFCHAESYKGKITGSGVYVRKGPGTNYESLKTLTKGNTYTLVSNIIYRTEVGCSAGWYQIYYSSSLSGYVCSSYVEISLMDEEVYDEYDRPWTTPKGAIIGGAKFITESYIKKGQFTSYLKKFNVNPNGAYNVYNHQYMANLAAPYSEAFSSYKSYRDNGLLNLPLEFTIPVFLNMNDYYNLPEGTPFTDCQTEITDEEFEAELNEQNFPESYKCKLRLIHNTYPNWTFKALHTNLDFNKSVIAEQNVSSIQGGNKYYDLSSGDKIQTEKGWYRANYDTVAYYLDPRNFLQPERILMFEDLGYSENYTTTVVQSILKGTFMEEYSIIDNESYAEIFVEAGEKAQISAVYLASLARQESGSDGSRATSGAQFTYQGTTYQGLYNFYNIGANSSAESPILQGLVWASGGSTSVIVGKEDNTEEENDTPTSLNKTTILNTIGAKEESECLVGLSQGTKLKELKEKLTNLTININGANDDSILKTGQVITISDGNTTFSFTISISGDVDGDGEIGATDYVKIKNYIMEKENSSLNIAQSIAADVDENDSIGATDYVKIKNSIMER